ncbi:MAG TPA: MraY family glycosyltransferase, partial [Gaiella sp.]|nr:MraY family glycosyltransferase [Gaiella sp.]
MEAAVTIAALPVAALALWVLLRAPSAASRLVAQPTGERWHERATPTFGGVGIACGLTAGVALAIAVGAVDASWELAGILAGCGLLFVAGLVDDVRHLSPLAKLAAQVAAAGIAIAAGLRVELVSNDVLGVAIAVFWLVGITNAFNLLDNMDGLAATLATVACLYFAIDAATAHPNDLVLVLSLSLAFACLGFLPFNLRPGDQARVFMGDGGSQLLGFLLGALGLAASWTTAGTTVATMLLPLLVLAIPILDTTLVTVRRLAERRPVTQGGTDHTSHRLVYYGLSETKAVGLLALIAVALGATSVAYNVLDRPAITALGVLVTFALLVQFGGFLAELSEQERRGRPGDTRLRHAIAVQPRRLVELVVDGVLVTGTFLAVFLLFVDGRGTELQRGTFQAVLPIVLGTTYVVYVLFGVYRRAWRYATTRDLLSVALASGIATLVAYAIVLATRDLGDFPRE